MKSGYETAHWECLLRAHRESDDRLKVLHAELCGQELVRCFDIVADGGYGKARTMIGIRRVAR
jgi:hypothetical protein